MLLNAFKSNRAVNYILFPFIGLLLWGRSLIHPPSYPFYISEPENFLYSPVEKLLGLFPYLEFITGFVILIVLSFMMLYLNNRYSIVREQTMLPMSLFIILVSGFTGMHTIHPVYPAAIFLLLAIFRLFSAFDLIKPYASAFDAGFFLGVASLFYFSSIILFPTFIIGIGILSRESQWRKFVIIFIGFLLPFLFAFSYAFLSGEWLEYLKILELNSITPSNHFKTNHSLQVYTAYLVLLLFIGSLKILQQYDTKKVSTRRYFIIFFLIFLCSVVGIIFIPAVSIEMLIISAIPLTFLITNFLIFQQNKFWRELLFALLFILVIAIQFFSF